MINCRAFGLPGHRLRIIMGIHAKGNADSQIRQAARAAPPGIAPSSLSTPSTNINYVEFGPEP